MKSFVAFFAIVAVVTADVSHLTKGTEADAQILKQSADVLPDRYDYTIETSNGIFAQEAGALKNIGREEEAIEAQGSYSYRAPNGEQIAITYIANENGYQPQGAHLPTPPAPLPIPDYILKAIEYIKAHPPKQEKL